MALAFAAFFLLLASYYILRPVRDEMAARTGVSHLQWLVTATFAATLLVVPAFGWVVKRVPRRRLVALVYAFLVLNLAVFQALFRADGGTAVAAAFFVWLSVFNLFVVSLFWSRLADAFTRDESHRFYGYIAAGGTAGAIAGPAVTALAARSLGIANLLVVSAVTLAAAGACLAALGQRADAQSAGAPRPIGGSIVAGIPLALKLPSLRGITIVILCYTAVSTLIYYEVVERAARAYADSGERTAFFATLDLLVNALALAMQLLGTRRIVQRFGLATALAVMPIALVAGLFAAAAWRSLAFLAGLQTVHRAGEFSLSKPGREMVYTVVDPESRYKAKNFIDTAVYRAGDTASAWLIAALKGAGLDPLYFAGLPAAVGWVFAAWRVGRRHDRQEPA